MLKTVKFRFYEELNDFLPDSKKKVLFPHSFTGSPSVKDVIEALGIPHTEVDLILVNQKSEPFSYRIKAGDIISVYPVFESLNISNVTRLRKNTLRDTKFILDVHLGKLAKYLRMTGFDTLYKNDYLDNQIIEIALSENRIVLTRDTMLLKIKKLTHGYWIRATDPMKQLHEVLIRFDLFSDIRPLERCITCNGIIKETSKESVLHLLKTRTRLYYNEFFQCSICYQVYWKGSHYKKIMSFADTLKSAGKS